MTMKTMGLISLTLTALFAASVNAEEQASPSMLSKIFNSAQVKEIEAVFENFLKRKPEIIEETLQQSAIKKETEKQALAKQVIAERKQDIFHDPDSPVGGNKSGKTSLAVFVDPYCGYCHRFVAVLEEVAAKDKDLRIVYKDIGILGEESVQTVEELAAAQVQGKYEAYQEGLRKANADSRNVRLGIAEAVGIDVNRLQQDMESVRVKKAVNRTKDLFEKLQLQGTPAFIVGDTLVGGMVDAKTLTKILEQARKQSA